MDYKQDTLTATQLVEFLCGASSIDGAWFGERHPHKHGLYWWREYLHLLAAAPIGVHKVVETDALAAPFYELKFIMRVLDHEGKAPIEDWRTARGMAREIFERWHPVLSKEALPTVRAAAPVPQQELTDDEIMRALFSLKMPHPAWLAVVVNDPHRQPAQWLRDYTSAILAAKGE